MVGIGASQASEALIQGTLPRPSELEVYLGESGIYVRQLQEEPVGVSEGGVAEAPLPGTALYLFE
jgi:ATP-dependent Clp protease ATP-binding subunit ClpC